MDKTLSIIVQAHMGSTRLPRKIMKPILGEPALYRMIERLRFGKKHTNIVIATSTLPADDVIIEACEKWGVNTFRGSDSDVLSRYYGAAQKYPADAYMRICSDSTMIDPAYNDRIIDTFFQNDYDFVAGGTSPHQSWPYGIGGDIFTPELLEEAYKNASTPYEHEHVQPYMTEHAKNLFHMPPEKENYRWLKLTLDYPGDYDMFCKVFEALYTPEKCFTLQDIVAFLKEHPDIAALNGSVVPKE